MTRLFNAVFMVFLFAAACSDPTAPVIRNPDSHNQPATSPTMALPIELTFKAENPCTEKIVIYKVAGTAYANRQASRREVLGVGTVKSNDGFSGQFDNRLVFEENRQVIDMGEFDAKHGDGRTLVLTLALLYTEGAGRPAISVEKAQPVRCSVGAPTPIDLNAQ